MDPGSQRSRGARQRAKEAAALPLPRTTARHYSLAFLRRRATERATIRWREDIESWNAGRRTFRLPTVLSGPGIRPQIRQVSKAVATRFFQLLSGHAMVAPFLKEMGMNGFGQMLAVREGETEQGASL